MKEGLYEKALIGELVTEDFRTAELFKRAGIDFCCGGKKSLENACKEKNIEINQLIHQLEELKLQPASSIPDFKDWSLDTLISHIVNSHHKYIIKTLPDLLTYTQKIASVHGSSHPELIEIAELFEKINIELLQHLKNEEEVLFPAIKEAEGAPSVITSALIHSEISRMTGEHEFAGAAMDKINSLSSNYKVPAEGCNTYRVTFKLLEQFEDDLHIHVHLENNILYPKALQV